LAGSEKISVRDFPELRFVIFPDIRTFSWDQIFLQFTDIQRKIEVNRSYSLIIPDQKE